MRVRTFGWALWRRLSDLAARVEKWASILDGLYILTRRRGANTAHTQTGRRTHEATTRECTHKHHTQTHRHTQTHTNTHIHRAMGGKLTPSRSLATTPRGGGGFPGLLRGAPPSSSHLGGESGGVGRGGVARRENRSGGGRSGGGVGTCAHTGHTGESLPHGARGPPAPFDQHY